jgi:hypothetical protein
VYAAGKGVEIARGLGEREGIRRVVILSRYFALILILQPHPQLPYQRN